MLNCASINIFAIITNSCIYSALLCIFQPSIEFLVKFATGKDVGKKRGKKVTTPTFLKRPIICICNDVYVPALRPLRQLAFIIHFPQTSSAR